MWVPQKVEALSGVKITAGGLRIMFTANSAYLLHMD